MCVYIDMDIDIYIYIYIYVLPPITKTIQVRRTRHAGHCWRSKDELISNVLLWTPTYGCAKVGRPARTYIQQLCEDTGCNFEDLPEAMNDREKWRKRVRDIHAGGATWWWWYIYEQDLISNNRQKLIQYRAQPNQTSIWHVNPYQLVTTVSFGQGSYFYCPLMSVIGNISNEALGVAVEMN